MMKTHLKKMIACTLAALFAVGMTACGSAQNVVEQAGQAVANVAGNAEKLLKAEGRTYDSIINSKVGETTANTFFEWTVHGVTTTDVYGDTEADLGMKWLVVDISTKNIWEGDDAIPIGNWDFTVIYDTADGDSEEVEPLAVFADTMYPDNQDEEPGETIRGDLVIQVPADSNFAIVTYQEVYEDEFEGDIYLVECSF